MQEDTTIIVEIWKYLVHSLPMIQVLHVIFLERFAITEIRCEVVIKMKREPFMVRLILLPHALGVVTPLGMELIATP